MNALARRTTRAPLYAPDLAYVQHAGFGGFAAGATPGLLGELRRAGIRGGLVVDLGCGAGVWLAALRRAGYAALGVDRSPALVRIARRAAPGARVRVGSLHEVELPRCAAVTALGEVLSYGVPGAARAPSLPALFARVARALEPGGLFAFDVLVAARPPMAYRSWRAGDDWAVLVEVREEPERARLERDITTFRRVGGSTVRRVRGTRGTWRRARETHVLRVFSRAALEAELRAAGFSVRTARRYGTFALPPRRLAFLARRR